MTEKINVLVVEPGKVPQIKRTINTLEAFEKIIGGPAEIGCYLPQRVLLVCREDGKKSGLPLNRANPCGGDFIAGTFLLCGFEGDSFISLTASQQAEFQKHFAVPGEFMMLGKRIVCTSPDELALSASTLWECIKNGESVVITKWGGLESRASA